MMRCEYVRNAAEPTVKSRKRLWTSLGLVLVVLALLLGVTPFALTSYYQRQVERTLTGLEEDGLSTDFEALLPPQASGTNAADELAPLFEALEKRVGYHRSQALNHVARRLRGDPRQSGEMSGERIAKQEQTVNKVLARFAGVGETLDRALEADGCRFPVDWSEPFPELLHVSRAYTLCQLLEVRALRALAEGRAEEGWHDVERMARVIPLLREPIQDSQTARRFCVWRLTDTVRGGLAYAQPTAERRASLTRALEALEAQDTLTRSLRGELSRSLAYVERLRDDPDAWDEQRLSTRPFGLFLRDPFLSMDAALLASLADEGIRAAALPEDQAFGRMQLWSQRFAAGSRPGPYLPWLLQPQAAEALTNELEALARLRMARLALSLSASGELPAELPAGAPRDPFSVGEHALLWHRIDARHALLWTVYVDQKDDVSLRLRPDSVVAPASVRGDVVFELRLPR